MSIHDTLKRLDALAQKITTNEVGSLSELRSFEIDCGFEYPMIRSYIAELERKAEAGKINLQNVGMLRQWLNEDRITDPKKMVSNEDIMHWLGHEQVAKESKE